MPSYNPQAIEPRWQKFWLTNKTFRTLETSDKPRYYILDMFPYPSGAGLHVGHPEGYTATDILARYKRMRGFNVLHPIGWDAFGLPAEQHAIATGEHPRINTQRNIDNFRRQIQALGFSYDWDREIDTTDPAYFKWTQWIFLILFDTWYDPEQNRGRAIAELPIPPEVAAAGELAIERYRDSKRLAYQAEVPVNWCEALGTVLANEEVIDGRSERGNHPVVRMPMRQWLLRITAYAERLLNDLELLDWTDSIKKMQADWIGKSVGAEVDFTLESGDVVRVFTTRPDTLFGATYMVLAPEHALVEKITTPAQRAAVDDYRAAAARKSDFERTEVAKKKTGVWTGAWAVNPVNGEKIPVWIADYVLASYGTGAIMAVPAHDLRDWEFAVTFDLPIREVVAPPEGYKPSKEELALTLQRNGRTLMPFVGEGTAINSGEFNGLPTAEFKEKIIAWLKQRGLGTARVNYKLRDWLFSRQRYWGEPFPILHEVDATGKPTGRLQPLSLDELPLELPPLSDYKPTGKPEPPLSKAGDWLRVQRNGKQYVRETNTMPQWAGSCWYYIRYIDARNDKWFCDPQKAKDWLPVNLYVGGAEHAVLHLLYARFWHKVLFDRGYVHTPEPFHRLVNQGLILGEMEFTGFQQAKMLQLPNGSVIATPTGVWISATEVKFDGEIACHPRQPEIRYACVKLNEDMVEKQGDSFVLKADPSIRVDARAYKMSKSRGNVVNPDDVIKEYGADSLRLYEMFMGPLEAVKPWSMRGVEGVYRFLSRVWRLLIDERAETVRLNDTVQDVPPDRETLRLLHRTIQRVTDDIEGLRFNTAISAMMEFNNHLTSLAVRPRSVLDPFVLLLSPFAPHIAEELWQALGHSESLAYAAWPTYDPALLVEDEIEVPIQVNGKVRLRLKVAAGLDAAALEKTVLADSQVQTLLAGKTVKKVIVAGNSRLVNLVVAG